MNDPPNGHYSHMNGHSRDSDVSGKTIFSSFILSDSRYDRRSDRERRLKLDGLGPVLPIPGSFYHRTQRQKLNSSSLPLLKISELRFNMSTYLIIYCIA